MFIQCIRSLDGYKGLSTWPRWERQRIHTKCWWGHLTGNDQDRERGSSCHLVGCDAI